MFMQLIRQNKVMSYLFTVLRLYLGYDCMIAGYEKLHKGFDTAGSLKNAITNPVKGPEGSMVFRWYVSFLKHYALPNVHIFNVIVPVGEFLVGLGLLLGCLTTAAMFLGLVMNFAYLFAGTVSSNRNSWF